VQETISVYDLVAPCYAARVAYPLERELERFRRMMPAGGLALDVGCGPGEYTRSLNMRGLRTVGLDLSRGMLRYARIQGSSQLVCADMRRIPLVAEYADGCFVCASLLHLPRSQAPQAFLEFRRVLRPGGALYLGVKEGEGAKWVTGSEGHARFFVYYQPEEIDLLIRAAGFEIVDGWISPPGKNQRHNWINRFVVKEFPPEALR